MNANGENVSGCLGDIKNFRKNEKLEQVVAKCKSCTPNALGDLKVTLKYLSGTISRRIHHKFLTVGGYGKDITVGDALILQHFMCFLLNNHVIILTLQSEVWLRFSIRIQFLEMEIHLSKVTYEELEDLLIALLPSEGPSQQTVVPAKDKQANKTVAKPLVIEKGYKAKRSPLIRNCVHGL
ncbi:hypothetical protein CTI12_AA575140 [Artemisia annua]|uniref:Homologous recombination OB-fold protein OB-fold domain-containing protein n=1 Tax=Artemisia annua TaxID=35608 RepID=A0A2U1KQZ0_ARTAN|nr:hypothetical protein CTI12_AA575140 [Artemisia annua]